MRRRAASAWGYAHRAVPWAGGASSQPSTAMSRCRALGLVSLHILHWGVPSIPSWLKHKGDARGWVLRARSSSLRVERGSPSFGITRYQGSHCWFFRPRLFLPELQEGLFAAVNVHKSCLDENIGSCSINPNGIAHQDTQWVTMNCVGHIKAVLIPTFGKAAADEDFASPSSSLLLGRLQCLHNP